MRLVMSGRGWIGWVVGVVLSMLIVASLTGCEQAQTVSAARADVPRETEPAAPASDIDALVGAHQAFAFELYHARSGEEGNLIFSPYSITTALTMGYAGARGDTATQMAGTLHLEMPPEQLYPAANALDQTLVSRASSGEPEPTPVTPDIFATPSLELNLANSVWSQEGYSFKPEYLDILARHYGAGVQLVDFGAPEPAREAINQWVSDQTKGHIEDLISPGAIDENTRMVLANAIYFYGPWAGPFRTTDTHDDDFTLLDGRTVRVPMMNDDKGIGYLDGDGFQAIQLYYYGDEDIPAMVIMMPDEGHFDKFEQGLDADGFNAILEELTHGWAKLSLPRFKIEYGFNVSSDLAGLGMRDAFDPDRADFSGVADISNGPNLYVGAVLHKATIDVTEKGTEASAATGMILEAVSARFSDLEVRVDHPFLFAIYDQGTGEILFLGRVLDPSK